MWDPDANLWTSDESDTFVIEVLFASDGKSFKIQELGGGAIAPDGKVWGVDKSNGMFWYGEYYDPVSKKISESVITTAGSLCYSDMTFDNKGGMWLAMERCGSTVGTGLLYIPDPISGSQASWKEYHKEPGFKSDDINSLLWQENNLLWVGTDTGLARCQIETH